MAIIRVEQLYPWPRLTLHRELERYPHADVVWCQEEAANQGAWTFVDHRIEFLLSDLPNLSRKALYAGRGVMASPAEGNTRAHNRVQAEIVEKALTWSGEDLVLPFQRVTHLSQLSPDHNNHEETS